MFIIIHSRNHNFLSAQPACAEGSENALQHPRQPGWRAGPRLHLTLTVRQYTQRFLEVTKTYINLTQLSFGRQLGHKIVSSQTELACSLESLPLLSSRPARTAR